MSFTSVDTSSLCAVCLRAPAFQVGPHWRACERDLAIVVRAAFEVGDGFAPPVTVPLSQSVTAKYAKRPA